MSRFDSRYLRGGNAMGVGTNEAVVEIAMDVVRPSDRPSVGRVLSEPKKHAESEFILDQS